MLSLTISVLFCTVSHKRKRAHTTRCDPSCACKTRRGRRRPLPISNPHSQIGVLAKRKTFCHHSSFLTLFIRVVLFFPVTSSFFLVLHYIHIRHQNNTTIHINNSNQDDHIIRYPYPLVNHRKEISWLPNKR